MQERWVWIKGYEGHYQISNYGRIKSYKNGPHGLRTKVKFLTPAIATRGYYFNYLCLCGKPKAFRINRLVAEHFIPNPENKLQVNHLDGNKLNNLYTNLEWVTQSENIQHAINVLHIQFGDKGENHSNHKLTNKQVKEIRDLYKAKIYTYKTMGKLYGISTSNIKNIVCNKIWKEI